MLLSRACEYGMRAALHLGRADRAEYHPVRKVSQELGIPYPFLAKIVQTLATAGIVETFRGPTGGIRLARPAAEITLKEVVLAIDGAEVFTECVLGLPGCGNRTPCPLHAAWADARGRIHQMFEGTSIAVVAEQMQAHGFRLADLVARA